jgi:nitrite reductase (NADH) large subunit
MSALPDYRFDAEDAAAPIVVVGAGPVGVRVVNELCRRDPDCRIVIYGAERWSPYNRVRLSSALAGETRWGELTADMQIPVSPWVIERLGCAVVAIDRERRRVRDAEGREQAYRFLVLATGSTPQLPNLPGIDLAGVFVFRDMDDAARLAARRARTRRTVVLGGGLLGIEAARAMQRYNTEVVLIEHNRRLMPRQLDAAASRLLAEQAESLGIEVLLGDGPARILGEERVAGVQLRSGRVVACDTVVVAAGIRPNTQLALQAKLSIGRGIRVDDRMFTSDPCILAVGECAEHRGQVYGLVAPGLEQAAVAAHRLTGGESRYAGSIAATRLKVLHYPVFCAGETAAEQCPDLAREYVYSASSENIYRKIVVRRGRMIGALALGNWEAIPRIQESVVRQRRIRPWQLSRFRRTGELWPDQSARRVADWPAAMVVCNCTGVTRGRLSAVISGGCSTVQELAANTGASTVCGSCRPMLLQLLGDRESRQPIAGAGRLLGFSLMAATVACAIAFLPGLPYPDTVMLRLRWDLMWRDPIARQASGYVLLALALMLGSLGLRKRIARFTFGDYGAWRILHTAAGVAVLLGFLVHSGGRMGAQLNLLLASSFLGASLSGAVYAALASTEHRIDPLRARRLKSAALRVHIGCLWPLPVLLVFHIVQGYLF